MADGLGVKPPEIHAKPFLMEILWRLVCLNAQQKINSNNCKASYATYSNQIN
jgi:hypothetical protein